MRKESDIRDYLLGRLDGPARDAFEDQLLADANFHAQVRDAENDLFDDYAAGRLTPAADRDAFERLLLPGAEARLRTARLLLLTAAQPPVRTPWIGLLAACLALSVGLNTWLVTRTQKPVEISPAAPAVVTIELAASGERSVGAAPIARVRRPKQGEMVRLRFAGLDAGLTVSAEVVAAAGVVWRQTAVASNGQLDVWLPGQILLPGSYEVSLKASNRLVGFSELRVDE